jgi:phosphoketolase
MKQGRLKPELAELAPKGDRRMGANPHANGGLLLRDLVMPDFRDYAVSVPRRGGPGSPTPTCWGYSCATWSNSTRSRAISESLAPTRPSPTV